MATRYISRKSTWFYTDSPSWGRKFVLIYGDEVEPQGQHRQVGSHTYDEVLYRTRRGWVRSDRLMDSHPLEMYFVDVGQGDSIFMVTPGGKKILVDGGKGDEAYQFLVWKYRLHEATTPVDIDLMVVSHADEDHIGGLAQIVRHPLLNVRAIVHSGIAKYASGFETSLGDTVTQGGTRFLITRHSGVSGLYGVDVTDTMVAWRRAVRAEPGVTCRAVDSATGTIDVGDSSVTLHVLGPRLENAPGQSGRGYRWFNDAAHTVNGHSVVLRLDYGSVRVLLPGDINKKGAKQLLDHPNGAAELDAHVFKAPHHGSHEFRRDFLAAVHPQITVVSSGETPDHGHPRANFLGTVGDCSRGHEPLLFSTELVAHFAVDAEAAAADADDPVDPTDPSRLGQARRRFKKRLNGIINVRTDGSDLYCARRVSAGYQFVTYKQTVAPRDAG